MRSIADRIVPARFADRTLDTYAPHSKSEERALHEARRMAASLISGLALVGPPGVGKTHLAAGVVNALVGYREEEYRQALASGGDRHPAVPVLPMWVNVADLIVTLRSEMHGPMDDRNGAATVYQVRKHPALVVLDDLGREKVSDWTGETIYALVNARYEGRLPTLVTSNLSPSELAASTYWPAISRLAEDGALVKVEGTDRRLR